MKIRKLAAALTALVLLCSGTAWGEGKKTMFEKEWYLQALKDSVMSTGNNARLKKVIDRARSGEEITLATIGGSITEGAGASVYPPVSLKPDRPDHRINAPVRRVKSFSPCYFRAEPLQWKKKRPCAEPMI